MFAAHAFYGQDGHYDAARDPQYDLDPDDQSNPFVNSDRPPQKTCHAFVPSSERYPALPKSWQSAMTYPIGLLLRSGQFGSGSCVSEGSVEQVGTKPNIHTDSDRFRVAPHRTKVDSDGVFRTHIH